MAYYDLGTYSRSVTTSSRTAQRWFDRGLVWLYAFNHEEAIACFHKALEADSECAMAHWGIAYAVGPNYNKPWESFEAEEVRLSLTSARDAITRVNRLKSKATPAERALIDAVSQRYPESPSIGEFDIWNDAYANSMRTVYIVYSDDLDICCLFAEALMNRTPWQLWNLSTGQPAEGADTLEAITVLESAFATLEGAWDHPGLLHMYIHLMEMSPHPERALRHGDRLNTLVPDAGHLLHMATHIDVLCGDYSNVVYRNDQAIAADRKFLKRNGADNFYTIYRCHNYHFKVYGAMFLGKCTPALEAANELIETSPTERLQPMANWFEAFIPMKQHVLIRFGRWQDILSQSLPEDRELYCVTTAMMHYARAIALANSGDIAGAKVERVFFATARARIPDSRRLFNNTCLDILHVAEQMMLGELEYHQGHHDAAFGHLRRAVELDDNLPYDEPWGWMQPARHALGALLLEQGQYKEAEAVYRADLGLDATLCRACQHPGNVWSLRGLYECLTHRDDVLETTHIKLQLDRAMARAEVPITASCFCSRKGNM